MKWLVLSFLSLLIFTACQKNENEITTLFDNRFDQIKKHIIPDPALEALDATIKKEQNHWVLTGQTNNPDAFDAVNALADSLFGQNNYKNDFMMLPDKALGDSNLAIVEISVAPMRDGPRNSAQMVDQAIMGRVVKVFRKVHGWYLIQTDYGYVGWTDATAINRVSQKEVDAWQSSDRVVVTALDGFAYSNPDEHSVPVTDLVLNMILKRTAKQASWTQIETPDGRQGYVRSAVLRNFDDVPAASVPKILAMAKSMMGLPYLWGGNSSKANDCSGFTQTVFKFYGIQLPRDARQIAQKGTEVKPDPSYSNFKPGDLLFFGKHNRITHVAISLGGLDYIDQGGRVAIHTMDSTKTNYQAFRKKSFVTARRILAQ